jgi:hypothetical protein
MGLVGATLVILFKWRSLLQPMIALVDCIRDVVIYYGEQRRAEEIRRDVSTSPKALKWELFPWRIREADLTERLNLRSRRERRKGKV